MALPVTNGYNQLEDSRRKRFGCSCYSVRGMELAVWGAD